MGDLRFYDFAEDDFYMLKTMVNANQVRNGMCSLSQSICERYLKQLIVNYIKENNDNIITYQGNLKTHNLKRLINFLTDNLDDFCKNKFIMNH